MLGSMQPRALIRTLGVLAVLLLAVPLLGAAPGDDPLLDRQYHLNRVRAPAAWEIRRGFGQVIAVLDTGVDLEHEDLQGRLVPGIDLVDRGTPPDDLNGHGTFVAGVAAATLNNNQGGSGVAPRAKVMPVRVLDDEGVGTSDIVAEGIRWATDQGATVINLSLADVPGQPKSPTALITTDVELAIRQAALAGVVVVCAAGNEGENKTPYSEDLPALIVGATTRRDAVWEHSNYDENTLFAPGVQIISTYVGDPYAEAEGTSFAAPIVSAGAAMLRQHGLNSDQTRRRLRGTARPVGQGVGRVDIAAALGIEPQVRTTPKPEPAPAQDDPKARPKPKKPAPVKQPSPVDPKPRRQRPREQPSPIAPVQPVETAAPPKLTKADRTEPAPQVVAPATPSEPAVVVAAPAPPAGRSAWPFAVAGVLLFVVVVGLGGYLAARHSG